MIYNLLLLRRYNSIRQSVKSIFFPFRESFTILYTNTYKILGINLWVSLYFPIPLMFLLLAPVDCGELAIITLLCSSADSIKAPIQTKKLLEQLLIRIKENNEKTKKDRIRVLNPDELHRVQAYR